MTTANPSHEREQTAPRSGLERPRIDGADAPTQTAAPCPRCVALTAENTRLRQLLKGLTGMELEI